MNNKILLIVGAFILILGCKDKEQYTPASTSNTTVSKSKETHKVIVKEIEKAGGYAYVKVVENEEEFWIAIPNTNIEIGQTYYYDGGTKMTNFESNELNKTFEEVIFVQALRGHAEKAPKTIAAKKLELISQPQGGITVKDLLENASTYSGKEIMVKGKVVKVNNGILDRNWVHISDGTTFGDKTRLTFTTKEVIKVGDVVTFKGNVTLNKDFGYGYVYPVLIEEAELIK